MIRNVLVLTFLWGVANVNAMNVLSVPGELIVKTKENGVDKVLLSNKLAKLNVQVVRQLKSRNLNFLKLTHDASLDQKSLIQSINQIDGVEYAEPNFIYEAIGSEIEGDYVPDDEKFSKQWGLINIGQKLDSKYKMTPGSDIKMLKAWAHDSMVPYAAQDVIVAVIDTGINLKHRDLKDNIWKNEGEFGEWKPQNQDDVDRAPNCWDKSCNGLDDDGNGYIDDTHGWNWVAEDGGWFGKTTKPQDDHGHGSHCAGVIGAAHNGKGIAGINARVQLMGLKFLTKKGQGTLEGAVEAINYAADKGADVINASWGGGGHSQALFDSIADATERGVLFVAAAGNAALNNDFFSSVPSNYGAAGVLSVAASEFNDARAFFSNYGKKSVDVAAPGHVIYSTVLGKKKYQFMSGTSMAAPHVAGVAALAIGYHERFKGKPLELKKYLKITADRSVKLNWALSSGGRLNAYNVVTGHIPEGNTAPEPGRDIWVTKDVSIESAHPYENDVAIEYVIHEPGAKWIKLHFGKHHIESANDNVEIYDGKGNLFDTLTGFGFEAKSRAVKGDTVRLVLKTDKNVTEWGFQLKNISFVK